MDIDSTFTVDSGVARRTYLHDCGQQGLKDNLPMDGDPAGETVRSISPISPTGGS